jgi:2-hydroxychromene-2-carboxylate isomerase
MPSGAVLYFDIKATLRAATEAAYLRGVPTLVLGGALGLGDDRLHDAAALAPA